MLMCKGENKHEKQTTKGDDFWTKGWVVSLPYFCFLHHRAGYNVFDSSQWCSWWMWECHGGLRCGVGMLQNNISGNATHSEGFVPHPSRRINSHSTPPSCHYRCHTTSSSKRQTKEEKRNEEVGRKMDAKKNFTILK